MRKLLSLLAVIGLLHVATPACAQAPEAPSRTLSGRDLFALQYATDPQVRPNGKEVAYVRVAYDVMTDRAVRTIWLIDTATREQRPVAAAGGDASSPKWSPDGKRLAFVSAPAGGKPQVFVRWSDSGATAKVTDLTDAPSSLEWSPDGASLAFLMFSPEARPVLGQSPPKPEGAQWADPLEVITEVTYRADNVGYLKPGYRHVYVVSADGGAPRQLTFGACNEVGPISWSPDGRSLFVAGNRHDDWRRDTRNTELLEVAFDGAPLRTLTDRAGPDIAPAVSPDGATIAYLGLDEKYLGYQNMRVYLLDRKSGQSRLLTGDFDRTVEAIDWAVDGRSLFARYADHGVSRVARIRLDGKRQVLAEELAGAELDRPYTGGDFSVARDGAVAYTSGSSMAPPDISLSRGGKTTRLTNLNEGLLHDRTLSAIRPLRVISSFDHRPIDAWVVTPPGFDRSRKYPMILEIHGGPFSAYGPTFATDMQLYAAAGYVVVYSNPRGSTSYGEEFANLIHHEYPGHDYDDLMSVVDAAIAEGYVDEHALFVTGGSGGGTLTAWIVGRTDRFRAAAAQKPVINWTSEVLTTDVYTFMAKYWFGVMPWEDADAYWRRSPLSLVGNVKTPTLVVVGEKDVRTPVSESEQYFQALQLRGVPTALVKVPGASHGGFTARPSQSAAKASAILAWFDRYRTGAN